MPGPRPAGRSPRVRLSPDGPGLPACFTSHLEEAGLGTVSEVFDGDPPHRPGGAIAQAWSVAELLRLAMLVGG